MGSICGVSRREELEEATLLSSGVSQPVLCARAALSEVLLLLSAEKADSSGVNQIEQTHVF